jgi:hypothetical protein
MKADTHILLALFKSTVEQSTALTDKLKQKPKQDFVIWQKQGFKMLEGIEKQVGLDIEYLEKITDIYHNINIEIKRSFKE